MSDIFIELEKIDTSEAAKNFAELLQEDKTYFLNGNWGSGKSTFLQDVNKNKKIKLITMDFWRLTDNRSMIEVTFSKLHPFFYLVLMRLSIVALVMVSILMTNVVDLGLGEYFGSEKSVILKIGGLVSLGVAVWNVFKYKSDELYSFLLTRLHKFSKILVIDDFDRMLEKQQEDCYKLFSLINGKLPIIFVGDMTLLYKRGDNYLSKIIDRQVELPFVLHSSNIWDSYFQLLEKKFGVYLSENFKKRVKSDQRNLRDREHFNDYVNKEFFTRRKFGRVQVEQQLLIIYAYLFYPELYKKMLNNIQIVIEENEKTKLEDFLRKGYTIKELLSEIQKVDNEQYPLSFNKNSMEYFLYEVPMNRTKDELDTLFVEQSDKFIPELLNSDQKTDFYQYLNNQFADFSDIQKKSLLNIVINESMKFKNSPSMTLIVQEKYNEIVPPYKRNYPLTKDVISKIVEMWENILKPAGLDQSEIIYFLEKHRVLSFHDLGCHFHDLDIGCQTFTKYRRKDFLLLTYLASVEKFSKFDSWDSSIWDFINHFNDTEFLSFWTFQSILSNEYAFDGFDIIPENKKYILWTGRYMFAPPNDYVSYEKTVILNIREKLNQMESNGFVFEAKIDELKKPLSMKT